MIRSLLTAVLLLGTLHTVAAAAASGAGPVVVQDPFLELRSGPGRGFPVFHVVDRGTSVDLLRRRTDWIKVRSSDGTEGWVHRSQLERTLTPGGEPVTLPGPSPEARTEHRWEVGLVTGGLEGASLVGVQAAWAATPTLHVRADAAQLLGDYSNGWLGTVGVAHVFAPHWRVSPFVGIGGGVLYVEPKATLVQPDDRTDSTAYAGLGLRGYLTNRFLLQAEYRQFVVFTSRDDNEEIDAWTVSFVYFF
jgi:opacity protein-like surface antigen